jgi:methylated-DNA-[protein]-cysteine S-methyltransferase
VRTAQNPSQIRPATEPRSRLVVSSPLGDLGLVADGATLARLILPKKDSDLPQLPPLRGRNHDATHAIAEPVLLLARRELDEYFRGDLRSFTIPLHPVGTEFQLAVWESVLGIPYGATATYGEIARGIGPGVSPRAVGRAVGQNPLALMIPCHRVVGSDGGLTGYGGGLHRKRYLLDLEQRVRPAF